jgi:hypothetical protein
MICSNLFVIGTKWMLLVLMNWCGTSTVQLHDEQALGSFTLVAKLKQLRVGIWLILGMKQLDTPEAEFDVPCPVTPGTHNYLVLGIT